jgi:hypothetical protein
MSYLSACRAILSSEVLTKTEAESDGGNPEAEKTAGWALLFTVKFCAKRPKFSYRVAHPGHVTI